MDLYTLLNQAECQRVSDGTVVPILSGCKSAPRQLVLLWPQLGDFDSLEYAWWLQQEGQQLQAQGVVIRAIGIGNLASGQRFCTYTGFPTDCLSIQQQNYTKNSHPLSKAVPQVPSLSMAQNAWLNLLLICAGIGSPGTLAEVFRGLVQDKRLEKIDRKGFHEI